MSLLTHPLARGFAPDDPGLVPVHGAIVRSKPFLRRVYDEWYDRIQAALPSGPGRVLEVGAGGGFLDERVPGLIASEIVPVRPARLALDATALPLAGGSLKAIVMTNVLHHVGRPRAFFADAARVVRPGGVIIMVEPWVSAWSRVVYRWLHHEPFEPDATAWELPGTGRLSAANGALPWLVFGRDRAQFEREFPAWRIEAVDPCMPFAYLLSGGVTRARFVPGWSFGLCRRIEEALGPLMPHLAMFAVIRLRRRDI
ncbi:MAG: class I SAM-dependent methyltransferase [Vicinamibacterales bacterium]